MMRPSQMVIPALAALAFALTGCGGGGGGTTIPSTTAPTGKGAFTVKLSVPSAPKGANERVRKAFAASAATQGIVVNVYVSPYSGTSSPILSQAFNVSATSASCPTNASDLSRTCTLSIPVAAGTYDIQAVTYDQAPSGGTIPGGAHELGYGFVSSQAVASGATNSIALTVEGIPNSVSVTLPINVLHLFTPLTMNASVAVLDAAGSVIMGPFIDTAGNAVNVTVADSNNNGVTTFTPSSFNSSLASGVAIAYAPSSVTQALQQSGFTVQVTATVPNTGATNSAALSAPASVHVVNGITGGGPAGIAIGSDYNLWFTMPSSQSINYVNTTTFALGTSVSAQTGIAPLGTTPGPDKLLNGPDGQLWISNSSAAAISAYNLGTTALNGYTLTHSATALTQDGTNIWAVQPTQNTVSQITTSGVATPFAVPSGGAPQGIAYDGAGHVWVTETNVSKIAVLNTNGTLYAEYSSGITAGALPFAITKGSDGNMWFTEAGHDSIARITPTGTVTEFIMTSGSYTPQQIISGPDGNLWFTINGGSLGRFDINSHAFSIVPISTSGGTGGDLVDDSDEIHLWVSDQAGGSLIRITP